MDSAFGVFWRRMRFSRLVIIHDAVMLGLDEMLEVSFDRFHRVLLANEIRRFLADHHLCGVRVAAHRARDDRRVSHAQTFDAAHTETVTA